MIQRVTIQECTFAPVPERFEAGTPPISQAIGLGAAIRWMGSLDWEAVTAHEADVVSYAAERLAALKGVTVIGNAPNRVSVVSFVMDMVHPHDIGTVLDTHGVAVRAGHHCAQPLMQRFGVPATVRASFALYNTRAEVDRLVEALSDVRRIFG
jgi:cysteine desulfurase/selenocysteine lyase